MWWYRVGSLGAECLVRGCPPCQGCARREAQGRWWWCVQCCCWWDNASQQGLLGLLSSDCPEVLCQMQPDHPCEETAEEMSLSPSCGGLRKLSLPSNLWEGWDASWCFWDTAEKVSWPSLLLWTVKFSCMLEILAHKHIFNYTIDLMNYIFYLLLKLSKQFSYEFHWWPYLLLEASDAGTALGWRRLGTISARVTLVVSPSGLFHLRPAQVTTPLTAPLWLGSGIARIFGLTSCEW